MRDVKKYLHDDSKDSNRLVSVLDYPRSGRLSAVFAHALVVAVHRVWLEADQHLN